MNLPQHQRTFDKRSVSVRERLWICGSGSRREISKEVTILSFVFGRHGMDWVVGVGELGCGVDELAAAEVRCIEPDTDIQSEGPAKKWEHTHTFTPVGDDATEIHEHIEYEHKSGFWGLVARVLFAKPNLYLMFTYRKLVTRWHLRGRESNASDGQA